MDGEGRGEVGGDPHLALKWLLFFAVRTIGSTSAAVAWRAWRCHTTDVPLSLAKTHQSNLNKWPRDPVLLLCSSSMGRGRPSGIYTPVKACHSARDRQSDGLARPRGPGFPRSPTEVKSGNAPDLHTWHLVQAFAFVGDTDTGNRSPTDPPTPPALNVTVWQYGREEVVSKLARNIKFGAREDFIGYYLFICQILLLISDWRVWQQTDFPHWEREDKKNHFWNRYQQYRGAHLPQSVHRGAIPRRRRKTNCRRDARRLGWNQITASMYHFLNVASVWRLNKQTYLFCCRRCLKVMDKFPWGFSTFLWKGGEKEGGGLFTVSKPSSKSHLFYVIPNSAKSVLIKWEINHTSSFFTLLSGVILLEKALQSGIWGEE